MDDAYGRRRRAAFEALGDGVMVLPAAPPLIRSRDVELRYRPDSELHYLTGLAEPGAVAVLVGGERPRFVLFVTPPNDRSELWEGHRLTPEEAAALHGADECHPVAEVGERLPALLDEADPIFFRVGPSAEGVTSPASRPAVWMQVAAALGRARTAGQRSGTGPRSVVDPGEILDGLRLHKDASEVALIRRAVRASATGHRAAARAIGPGVSERVIEGVLEGAFRKEGAEGSAFAPIVASGANALVLHYSANHRAMRDGELVLVDAGAEVGRYAGDLTRTWPVNGRFTTPQREAYEVVLEAREAALAAVSPGRPVSGVHDAAVFAITSGLVGLGVLSGELDELIGAEACKPFFPHNTTHWLGLDVHDPGDYARGGESRRLEAGMVLTVEPGLYFPRGASPERYAGIGIRVEDDVLVTAKGPEVLSAGLPVAADEVEAMVGEV